MAAVSLLGVKNYSAKFTISFFPHLTQQRFPYRMWYRITQKRSTIGLPKKLRNTAMSMGLKRRGNVIYQKVNAANAGQILTLKELLEVQVVDKALTREEERLLSRKPPGYSVEN